MNAEQVPFHRKLADAARRPPLVAVANSCQLDRQATPLANRNRSQRRRRRRRNALGRFQRNCLDASGRRLERGIPANFVRVVKEPVQLVPCRTGQRCGRLTTTTRHARHADDAVPATTPRDKTHTHTTRPRTRRSRGLNRRRRRRCAADRSGPKRCRPRPRASPRPTADTGAKPCALASAVEFSNRFVPAHDGARLAAYGRRGDCIHAGRLYRGRRQRVTLEQLESDVHRIPIRRSGESRPDRHRSATSSRPAAVRQRRMQPTMPEVRDRFARRRFGRSLNYRHVVLDSRIHANDVQIPASTPTGDFAESLVVTTITSGATWVDRLDSVTAGSGHACRNDIADRWPRIAHRPFPMLSGRHRWPIRSPDPLPGEGLAIVCRQTANRPARRCHCHRHRRQKNWSRATRALLRHKT